MKKIFVTLFVFISSLILTGSSIKTITHAFSIANIIEALRTKGIDESTIKALFADDTANASEIEILFAKGIDTSTIEALLAENTANASETKIYDMDKSDDKSNQPTPQIRIPSSCTPNKLTIATLADEQPRIPTETAVFFNTQAKKESVDKICKLKPSSFTAPEDLIGFYTGYTGYDLINAYCRGYLPEDIDQTTLSFLKSYVENFDKLFETKATNPPLVVYRGLNIYGFLNTIAEYRPNLMELISNGQLINDSDLEGKISSDPSFLSTSYDLFTAMTFIEKSIEEITKEFASDTMPLGVLLEIDTSSSDEDVILGNSQEREYIFRRQTKVKIDSIEVKSQSLNKKFSYFHVKAHIEQPTQSPPSVSFADALLDLTERPNPKPNSKFFGRYRSKSCSK